MEKDQINLEEEEENRHDMQMCQMCQMCPCMQQNANMMEGMYMNSCMKMGKKNPVMGQMAYQQQPMMGQMCYPNGRDEYEDDFDEDDSDDEEMRRRRRRHFYPYYYGGFPHYGHMYKSRPESYMY